MQYAYASPVGLVPCPTLSIVIGLSLLMLAMAPRALQLTVAAVGLFYGLFGMLRLHVWIDVALLTGSLALLGAALGRRKPRIAASLRLGHCYTP